MEKIKNIYFNMSMRKKLLVTYLPIVVLAIFAVGFLASNTVSDAMYEQSFDVTRQALNQEKIIVDKNLSFYDTFAKNIYLNGDNINYFQGDYEDAFEELNQINEMTQRIGALLINQEDSINLSIIRNGIYNEQIVNNFDHVLNDEVGVDYLEETNGKTIQVYNHHQKFNVDWYEEANDYIIGRWLQIEADSKFNNLSYLVSLRNRPRTISSKKIGVLKLTVRIEDLLSVFYDNGPEEVYPFMLYDSEGNNYYVHPSLKEIYDTNEEVISSFAIEGDSKTTELSVNDLVLVKEHLKEYGLTLVSVTSVKSLMEQITNMQQVIGLIAFVVIILVGLLTLILSSFYVKRLQTVVDYLQKFHEGDFDKEIPFMNNDEVGYLAIAFNDMSKEIQTLVNKVYKSELEMKEIEYSLLQHQINPHFLYNTLSSIGRLADFGDKDTIKKMTEAMVSFYRLTLSNGQNVITVGDEIQHIQSYLDVFSIRYDERMIVHYDLNKELFSAKTIKIILQPFVENILEHGYSRVKKVINITIRLYELEDYIYFQVVDDGVGMDEEQLKRVMEGSKKSRTGYAIANVKRRLKLHYDEDLLDIKSHPGSGTQVTIKIPKGLE